MFLKFENSAVPIEQVRQITVWYAKDVQLHTVEGTPVRKSTQKLKLTIQFSDGSAWNIDLKPEPKDREAFLEKFLREINKRVVTDVPVVVKKLLEKEGKDTPVKARLKNVSAKGDVVVGEKVSIKKTTVVVNKRGR